VECQVINPEDGQKCGTKFANDPGISLVIDGALITGSKELYDAVKGKAAVMVANAFSTEDFVTPSVVSYSSGLPGVFSGMASFIAQDLKAKKVAVVLGDNAGGRASVQSTLKPIFDKAGVTLKPVFVDPTATAPDVASKLQAAGAGTADAILVGTPVNICVRIFDALRSAGQNPKVVSSDLCASTPMTEHLKQIGVKGTAPDGWYFANYGYSYFVPDTDSGLNTYVNAVKKYGKPAPGAKTLEYTGEAGYTFAQFMTATKIINKLGPKADDKALDSALHSFTGPGMLQAGKLKCGIAPLVSVCGREMGIDQYSGGKWVSVRDGVNKKPIKALPAA
jgi:branched-chain amino acid transport system substrate-binding protein